MQSRTRTLSSTAAFSAADRVPRVEFLWFDGCPSWERALSVLGKVMAESGFDPATIEMRQVVTPADVEREHFSGSPTIRMDGDDIQPSAGAEPAGLTCRIYRLRDGRISPLPDPEDIREALLCAAQRRLAKVPFASPTAAEGELHPSPEEHLG